MDEVPRGWRKLSLTSEEGEKIKLSKSHFDNNNGHVLAARLMTRRALNVEAVGRNFKPLWRGKKDFEIREAGDPVLLFVFESESDAEQVLATEPWSFNKHMVLFQRYDFSIPTKNLRFMTSKFWVQMHGLPIKMLNTATAIELGGLLGTVSTMEPMNAMIGGDFLRAKVEANVLKPLSRGRRVALNDRDEVWVSLKYEKLPNFCYCCGMITHTDKECEQWIISKGTLDKDSQGYGAWLRATPHNPGKACFTKVSGMGDGLGSTQSRKAHTVQSL